MNSVQVNSGLVFRLLLLLSITAFCLSPVLQADFTHVDDDGYVYNNELVREGVTLENITWALQTFEMVNWHPLTWISYMIDVELFGVSAMHFHGINLLLHLLNAALLFLLIVRILSRDAALIAALVFAIHPLHVETVAWISQRKELLSFLFMLISTHAYLSYKLKQRLSYYYGAILAFVCAVMSKPMAVSFPVLLILIDYWPLRAWPNLRDRTALIRYALEKLPFVVLAGIASTLTLLAQSPAMEVVSYFSFGSRLVLVAMAYVEYLRQFLMPLGLAFYYPVPELSLSPYFMLCVALLLGLSAGSIILARRYPVLLLAWWWFVVSLLPVIGLIKVGEQFVADRYTYLPLTGIIIAIAYLVHHVAKEERVTLLIGSTVWLFFCGMITFGYSASWQDDISLARRSNSQNDNNWIAIYSLVRGVEAQLTQSVLDDLTPSSNCLGRRVDIFTGFTSEELSCLQQANDPTSQLVMTAYYHRIRQLEDSAESLSAAGLTASPAEQPAVFLFQAMQNVLEDDLEGIRVSAAALNTLPMSQERSAALFLVHYWLEDLEAANLWLNEFLREYDEAAA